MKKKEWNKVPSEFETIRDKWDYLDWDRLPAGRCDMNYRSSSTPYALLRSVLILLFVSWLCFAVTDIFRWHVGLLLKNHLTFALLLLLGAVAGMTAMALRRQEAGGESSGATFWVFVATLAIGPVLLWAITISIPFTRYQSGALIVLALFAFPATLLLADAIATHSVFWVTAHPGVDHATMIGWRSDWSCRWTAIPERAPRRKDLGRTDVELHHRVMRQRTKYLDGVLLLFALTVVLPVGLYLLLWRAPTHRVGACITIALLISLAAVATIRCVNWPGSFLLYLQCVANWFTYQHGAKNPPWVLESPFGSGHRRRWLTYFALFLASAALLPLADWANWLLLAESQRGRLPSELVAMVAEQKSVGLNFLPVTAHAYGGLCMSARWLVCLLLPVLYLLLAGYLVAGPVIAAHHAALEAPAAYENHTEWNRFDGYVERLQHSSNPFERSALFIGLHTRDGYPMLLDGDLLFEHAHLLGGTGTGKTALGLTTHMIQLIRRNDGAVVIIDCKGDPALFHTARLEAQKAGRTFKWLTNKPGRSTYIFNPLDFRSYRHFTLAETVGFLAQALNMIHGQDYGRAWFTIAARILMKRSFEASLPNSNDPHAQRRRFADVGPINSFRDLNRLILRLAIEDDVSAAQHLAFLIECLADFEQLNLAPNRNPNHPALEHAIHMPEVVREKQVIYFYLEGATDLVSVAEIGRLALFSLLSACIAHKDHHGQTPRAYCIADEAQALIANNISNVLAQARSHGLAVFLSHQSMSQLAPAGGPDLRELVMSCTCVKQIFSARDAWLQEYISTVSGRTKCVEFSQSWSWQGWIPTYTYTAGPRLTPQDIFDVNRDENLCIATIERGKGLSRTNGYFPLHIDWPLTENEYQTRSDATAWPADSPATVTINPPWPEPTEETIVPENHPPSSSEELSAAAEAKLRKLREQLDD